MTLTPKRIFSQNELNQAITDIFKAGAALIGNKNRDYAGQGDPFRNLRRHGAVGFLVRMEDKLSRLNTLLQPGGYAPQVQESAYDTALDLMNYSALLIAWMMDQEAKTTSDRSGAINPPQPKQP